MTDTLHQWATWREIQSQPTIWTSWADALPVADLRDWVAHQNVDEVWFCGAGTSAYIGDMIVAGLEGAPGPRLRAVPTTDLVARPQAYLRGRRPLVVQFGRSGNSAETLGSLDALDVLAPDAPRLHVTCNAKGALATRAAPGPLRVVLLPEATHDAGFAMTSSFSTMLLTALAIFDPATTTPPLAALARQMVDIIPKLSTFASTLTVPDRIVFLGTGTLGFAARECALKLMELTAGQVPALWDTSLGFRHGPKSFVTGATDIVLITSLESPSCLYEADLAAELRSQFPQARVTTIGPGADIDIAMTHGPLWSVPLVVALGQILAVRWSAALGLNVDDPFAGLGTLSRVVAGVTLYPVRA
jgi:tagatose-6-phosphate ketose/aldose isomerase